MTAPAWTSWPATAVSVGDAVAHLAREARARGWRVVRTPDPWTYASPDAWIRDPEVSPVGGADALGLWVRWRCREGTLVERVYLADVVARIAVAQATPRDPDALSGLLDRLGVGPEAMRRAEREAALQMALAAMERQLRGE